MYYFLIAENVNLDEYNLLTHLFSELKNKKITLEKIIDKYIPRIDENYREWTVNKASFFEFFSFLHYCVKNNINLEDVYPIKDFNLIMIDGKLKLLNDYNKVLTKKDFIVSLRHNFKYQLFEICSLFTNIIIPDRKKYYELNKLSVVTLLLKKYSFKSLKNIYWDISIIFISNKDYIKYIKNILKSKYRKFVIKSISSEMWKWVYTFDVEDKDFDKKIEKILNYYIFYPLIVVPFFNIKKEYRLYYTYIDKKVVIHTAKNKNNKNIKEAFKKWTFELYKNLNSSFSYFDKDKFTERQHKFLEKIIRWVWWKVWVLEFIHTKDDKLYLMEINHLWWLLTCNKKDIDFLNNFYNTLYSSLF